MGSSEYTARDGGEPTREAAETKAGLDELGEASEKAGQKVKGLGDKLEPVSKDLAKIGGEIKKAGLSLADTANEFDRATQKANAYFGETGEAAQETASVIESVYASGVGESVGKVSEAVIGVKRSIQDLDAQTLSNLTEQAMAMESVYGVKVDAAMREVDSLMRQFGLDAQTAMDYVAAGAQGGLDKTGQLGGSIVEHAGKFSQAGYSASEYFQLLNNGMDGGASSLEQVNEAINGVSTRLSDGTFAGNLTAFSAETQNLFRAWQEGGASQKDVINSIVQDIGSAKTEQEALTMAAAAFGMEGQELNLGLIESLNSVGNSYADVAGKAGALYEQTVTPQQEVTAAVRELEQALMPLGEQLVSLAQTILPPIVDIVAQIAGFFANNPWLANIAIVLGTIIMALTALAPVIVSISAIVTAFGVAVLGPIGLAIAAVAVVIGTIITVVQNWGAITEWLGNVFAAVWGAILTFFQETIPAAIEVFKGVVSQISEWWAGVWQGVSSVFIQIWEGIREFFAAAWQAIVDTVTAFMDTVSLYIQTAMQAIYEFLVQIWEGIRLALETALTAIKQFFENIWNGMKGFITTVMGTIRTVITTAMDLLRSSWEGVWNGIKEFCVNTFNGVKDFIATTVDTIKEKAVTTFQNLVEGIKEHVGKIADTVKEGFNGAIQFITELPGKALQWGKDFIGGLISGIKEKASELIQSVKDLADDIADFLHFSRPDKGPLREYERWMPDMMRGLAYGIKDNLYLVTDQVKKLGGLMAMDIQAIPGAGAAVRPAVIQNHNVMVLDGKVVAESMNESLGLML